MAVPIFSSTSYLSMLSADDILQRKTGQALSMKRKEVMIHALIEKQTKQVDNETVDVSKALARRMLG